MTAAEIPADAKHVATAKQAAKHVGVPLRGLPDWLAEHGIGPVAWTERWGNLYEYRSLDVRVARSSAALPVHVCTASEAAALIAISRPNLDKWLREREIVPVAYADHPVGRLYAYGQLAEARKTWAKDPRREADEKRRAAALANAADG